jgi:hypothetical protein
MAIHPKQQKLIECFFPGLIADIAKVGAGAFGPELPDLKRKGAGLRGVAFHLTYALDDGFTIDIRISTRIVPTAQPWNPQVSPYKPSDWERFRYALHYGKKFADCEFRIDLDDEGGHHVHMHPKTNDHVPTSDVTPDVKNLEPLAFVAMVIAYRATGTYPLERKKKKP